VIQGLFKVSRDKGRDSRVTPVNAFNKEVFIRVVFYFSENGFTDIFMRDREFLNPVRLIDRFYIHSSTTTYRGSRDVEEVISS
jgi:hypothetical protein